MTNNTKWVGSAKKLKKYNVELIKDYVETINIALQQKADWHFLENRKVKNKKNKMVNVDKTVGEFCLMIKDCIENQYSNQKRKSR